MAGKLSDVKVGLPSRKMSMHKKDTPSSLTLNFGEVAPLCCFEMDGKTKIRGNVASIVRMPPLPRPVFGELTYKQYARFVPIKDVFRNFQNLRGGRSLTTQFGTFTPSSVPYITVGNLSALLLSKFCKYSVYASNTNPSVNSDSVHDTLLVKDLRLIPYVQVSEDEEYPEDNYIFDTVVQSVRDRLGIEILDSNSTGLLTFENCDFIVYGSGVSSYDDETYYGYLCFRLTRLGKVLYRILNGLQYTFDLDSSKKVSILPLLAFYKAYFDLFVPANTAMSHRNYTDSNAFRLSDYICEHDIQNISGSDLTVRNLFNSFLDDLSKCFYYQDPDYITSMISKPSISGATEPYLSNSESLGMQGDSAHALQNQQPVIPYSGGNLSALNVKLLLRLLPYVNKDTIIGGRLRQLIKSRFGYDVETLDGVSYTAGKFDLPIDISAISNMSDTAVAGTGDGSQLGWQGGQGVGYNKRDDKGKLESLHFNFKTDDYGFFIILVCIVPKCGFFQGLAPYLSHGTAGKFSIYDPAFDSLGFDLLTKDILFGRRTINHPAITIGGITGFAKIDLGATAFGYSPRNLDYKIQPLGIKSGDLVRQWSQKEYAPYYLDKFITPDTLSSSINGGHLYDVTVVNNVKNLPTATPELRRIGYDDWLENLNRIFYASGLRNSIDSVVSTDFQGYFGVDDNFICDNLVKASYFDHSKPSSESFETDGEGVSFAIDHA